MRCLPTICSLALMVCLRSGFSDEFMIPPPPFNISTKHCPRISNCRAERCLSVTDSICTECDDNNVLFKKTNGDRTCERMCSWNKHFCWPGMCADELTRGCRCAAGFQRVSNSQGTTCQLRPDKTPSIETCDFTVLGPRMERKDAIQTGTSTACQYKSDVFGNFQPAALRYKFVTSFVIDVPCNTSTKPSFIAESNFGVTDASLKLHILEIHGSTENGSPAEVAIQSDTKRNGLSARSFVSKSDTITINSTLKDGERLCVTYESKGGGYLIPRKISTNLTSVPYKKTADANMLCYRLDTSPPRHCGESGSSTCSHEPLYVQQRIVRAGIVLLEFEGWFDPPPIGGTESHASGIQLFDITVNEVPASKSLLILGDIKSHTTVNASVTSLTLNLNASIPVLYCVTLTVKDIADNVRLARRFLLYDNTSYIETRSHQSLYVMSASADAHYLWQTHHNDICVNWKDHFYNIFYLNNNTLLGHIAPDGLIDRNSIYEQQSGTLPVSGTPNLDGIIGFNASWQWNDGHLSPETRVANFKNQTVCKSFNVSDGQSYTVNILAIDIAGNTYGENRTVHIDRTVPHINRVWLTKNGYKRLYVHDSKDLSRMNLEFEALDTHSGVREVRWTFGYRDGEAELENKNTSVVTVNKSICAKLTRGCYCPDVGLCEIYNYSISLNSLVAKNKQHGDHNRNYYFTITVTNHAGLSNTEHVDILVDDSPPQPGVVYEGPLGNPDIDYTSDTSFLVHWHGFIDHESGIKMYRVGLADRCLTEAEVSDKGNTTSDETVDIREVMGTENTLKLPANFTGKRHVTVVAFNNAMDPSVGVCSDGITRDISAPVIRNITVHHGRWAESIACHKGRAWLLTNDLHKIVLHNVSACQRVCVSDEDTIAEIIPTRFQQNKDHDISEFMCMNLPRYIHEKIVYIPNDHISIKWDVMAGLSQIQDFFVGFGIDPSESASPGLVDYVSTDKNMFFKRRHEGIGTDDIFYMFIKAINKAGLDNVFTVGPVLIDETPPLVKHVTNVTLSKTDVVIGWENDTFDDLEQPEPISHILMQIDHGSQHVSPVLEWRLGHTKKCQDFTGGCFTFPIRRLQRQDTDLGLEFHAVLYVHNNAGHYTRVTTPTFRVPSRYPPGHAVILDIDPAGMDLSRDTAVHFTANTMCVKWTGFRHHENISVEVGIGTTMNADDTVSFHNISNESSYCVKDMMIKCEVLYYLSIRASCSGGQTVSSSNGVMIFSEANVKGSISVQAGPVRISQTVSITRNHNNTNSSLMFTFPRHLVVGRMYCATIKDVILDNVDISSSDADVKYMYQSANGRTFSVRPFVHMPMMIIANTSDNKSTTAKYAITLDDCLNSTVYQSSTNKIRSHWSLNINDTSVLTFEAAAVLSHCECDNGTCTQLISPFTKTDTNSSTTISGLTLHQGFIYKIAIRPCFDSRCLNYVMSAGIFVDHLPPSGDIALAEKEVGTRHTECHTVTIVWHPFSSLSGIGLYQWTVSLDDHATKQLTQWGNILPHGTGDNNTLRVSKCLDIHVHPHSTLFGCVRAYSGAGLEHTVCKQLVVSNYGYTYDRNAVYDFDRTSPNWKTVRQVLHSAIPGNKLSVLHDADLDFGHQDSLVTGAVLYANERDTTWYLMTSPYLPASCKTDKNCITSITTSTGYMEFEKARVPRNSACYICAHSNETSIERETFTEQLEEIQSCSNGFVIDTIPPNRGVVHVTNPAGYITDPTAIEITWGGFTDNTEATVTELGYATAIQQFVVSVGSRPGGNDLMPSITCDGASSTMLVRNMSSHDGTPVFFAVTAFDHAGNNITAISEELMVDTSGPSEGSIHLQSDMGMGRYVATDSMNVFLSGFHDNESGIRHFQVGVGSAADTMDIIPATTYTTDRINLRTDIAQLLDGHTYFINAVAINRAELSSNIVSTAFVLDRSAPIGGHVIDGRQYEGKDVDYQTETRHIRGSWHGFSDPHSGILYYRAGLGSRPYKDDVEPFGDVGLSTEFIWNGTFTLGLRYYITVEACNWAGLCTARSSDGLVLDNSPPIPGQVRVASGFNHHRYVPHRESVHVEWVGFEDPHSGLEHFDVCLGTAPLSCDIHPWFNCLLSSSTIKTGLQLPNNSDLYASVMATNKAGLRASQASGSFRVDDSPPTAVRKPSFLTDYNAVHGFLAQWEQSVLRISWKFEDAESPIVRHIITLLTHHEGHTPIEHVEIGAETKLTVNLESEQWLHNGDRYRVSVTACNAAGLCDTEVSDDLLIDATAPHLGGLKPPMTWYNWRRDSGTAASTVALSWYGFLDQESGIHRYFITISRTYSGQELSNGTLTVLANGTSGNSEMFNLTEAISPDDHLIISIWAENNAGMKSSIARETVGALSTTIPRDQGILEIQKHSCDVHYCNKCNTCAIIGQPCIYIKVNSSCNELDASDVVSLIYPSISVFGGLAREPQTITASSACLTGHWRINNISKQHIHRFEWSMGIHGQPVGEGIFDTDHEMPWNDVGLRTDVIHCLPLGRSLTHKSRYVVYLRAWYGPDQYSVFHSSPIVVDQTPPSIRKGGFVKDSDSSCNVDYDYIDWVDTITSCWHNVFLETQGAILYYTTALGTSVNSDDVYPLTDVGLQTSHTITNVSMSHGTRYFFTVTAVNNVGLHTSVSSDGFVVDTDNPLPGIVFTTAKHRDISVQSSNTTFSLSWYGYVDNYSGIRSYYAAVLATSDINTQHLKFLSVGLQNRVTFKNLNLKHGATYHGVVYAVDAAGHISNRSVSRAVLVDVTPPVGFTCRKFNAILEHVDQKSVNDRHTIQVTHSFVKNQMYKISGKIQNSATDVHIRFEQKRFTQMLPTAVNHDGTIVFEYNFLSPVSETHEVKLEVTSSLNATLTTIVQECAIMDIDKPNAVQLQQISDTMVAVNAQVLDKESSLYKVLVGAGTSPGGFQVRALSPVRGGNNGVIAADVPHGSHVYVTVIAENYAGLRTTFQGDPIIMDHTPPEIVDVSAHVASATVIPYNTVIAAAWKTYDSESSVKMCWCKLVGLTISGADDHTAPSNGTSCIIPLHDVGHGQRLAVMVTCVNAVQLTTTVTSRPVVISSQKPNSENAHVDFMSTDESSLSKTGMFINMLPPIQANDTCIHLAWAGFSDPSGVHHYEYRLLENNDTMVNWTSTGLHTQVRASRLDIGDGSMVTGHVRAVNHGGFHSDTIQNDIIVDGREPKLSGDPVTININENRVRLDWRGVFQRNEHIPVAYSLVVGSQSGFSDLADVTYVSTDMYEVMLPESSTLTPEINEIHVMITCTYTTGLRATYWTRAAV